MRASGAGRAPSTPEPQRVSGARVLPGGPPGTVKAPRAVSGPDRAAPRRWALLRPPGSQGGRLLAWACAAEPKPGRWRELRPEARSAAQKPTVAASGALAAGGGRGKGRGRVTNQSACSGQGLAKRERTASVAFGRPSPARNARRPRAASDRSEPLSDSSAGSFSPSRLSPHAAKRAAPAATAPADGTRVSSAVDIGGFRARRDALRLCIAASRWQLFDLGRPLPVTATSFGASPGPQRARPTRSRVGSAGRPLAIQRRLGHPIGRGARGQAPQRMRGRICEATAAVAAGSGSSSGSGSGSDAVSIAPRHTGCSAALHELRSLPPMG